MNLKIQKYLRALVLAGVPAVASGFFPLGLQAADLPESMKSLEGNRKAYMEFLYRYLPLPDQQAYTPEFFLANVDASLKARQEMPWGKIVPEREWKHFVLPVRINNENLDLSRPVFYEELKERIKGMSMEEAILEVNHWCHEKVSYKPSDARTSSPLSAISQAIGRCGEESTFTVAALRAVGIPARQVYTPRWAHADDNHAWVEAWANGKWHFLGACEPEAILDLGWFNAPAYRGIMMATNVFGNYDGPEEVLWKHDLATRINVTSNYAPVAEVNVKVVDPQGKSVKDADVNFCVYNYAEFYPLVTKKSDVDGRASLIAGKGDLVVWATDGKRYGYTHAKQGNGPVTVTLNNRGAKDMNIVPPPPGGKIPEPSAAAGALNSQRLLQEDSIRNAYIATFATETEGRRAARTALFSGENVDKIGELTPKMRGNSHRIKEYIENFNPYHTRAEENRLVALLENVSEKDLRDIPVEVIRDNVEYIFTPEVEENPLFAKYILNPRVQYEALEPYRAYLDRELKAEGIDFAQMRKNPAEFAKWIDSHIKLDESQNPQKLYTNPLAAWRSKSGDARGRSTIFVAAARTLGIPARINEVNNKTQYALVDGDNVEWIDYDFGTPLEAKGENGISNACVTGNNPNKTKGTKTLAAQRPGRLNITYKGDDVNPDPKYYSSFSISKIEKGVPQQLGYPEEATWSGTFSKGVEIDAGEYILTSGQRLPDGSVLTHVEPFEIKSGTTTTLPLTIRKENKEMAVIGKLSASSLYRPLEGGKERSLLSDAQRGYYVVGVITSSHEPSAHALNDIQAVAEEYGKYGVPTLMLLDSEETAKGFSKDHFSRLPANVKFGIDHTGSIRKQLAESLKLQNGGDLPVTVIANTNGNVVFVSTGYSIGLGETLLRSLKLANTKKSPIVPAPARKKPASKKK